MKTAPLNHPDGATGYRFEHRGKAMCYVTDTEHIPGKPDENILALSSPLIKWLFPALTPR